MGNLKLHENKMLTKTLTAALCASAVNVSVGDTVNTSVSADDDHLAGLNITFDAKDHIGCWAGKPGTYWSEESDGKFYIRSDMTWYSDKFDCIKPWGWSKDFIMAEEVRNSK